MFDSKCAVCTARIPVKSSTFPKRNWAEATCQLGDLHSRSLRFAAIARRVFGWCVVELLGFAGFTSRKLEVYNFYQHTSRFPANMEICGDIFFAITIGGPMKSPLRTNNSSHWGDPNFCAKAKLVDCLTGAFLIIAINLTIPRYPDWLFSE